MLRKYEPKKALFQINIYYFLICYTFYTFQTTSSTYYTAYTDACKIHYSILVNTTVFLKMNPRIRDIQKTKNLKIKILV